MTTTQMQAYTEEQRKALIEFNRAIISQYESYAVPESGWPDEVRLMVSSARIALASLTAEPSVWIKPDSLGFPRLAEIKAVTIPYVPEYPVELYTAPPAPALRLPGRVSCDGFNEKEPDEARNLGQCEGWNAYQAEALRLNATAPQPIKLPQPLGWKPPSGRDVILRESLLEALKEQGYQVEDE